MTITFDKGTTLERSIIVDYVNEVLIEGKLSASYEITVGEIFTPQDISELIAHPEFDAVEVSDGTTTIALQGDYEKIITLNSSFEGVGKAYRIFLQLA